jgi:hypothetical protein
MAQITQIKDILPAEFGKICITTPKSFRTGMYMRYNYKIYNYLGKETTDVQRSDHYFNDDEPSSSS